MTMAWQAILTKQPIDDSILRDFASHNKKESIMSTRAPLRTSDPKTSVLPRWVLQTKQPPPRESDAVNPKHRQHNGMTASQSLHGIVSLALCFRILPLVEHPSKELDDGSDRHGPSTDGNGRKPLLPCLSRHLEDATQHLHEDDLGTQNERPDEEEDVAAVDALEDVIIVVELAGIHEVEHLAEDEHVEDDGVDLIAPVPVHVLPLLLCLVVDVLQLLVAGTAGVGGVLAAHVSRLVILGRVRAGCQGDVAG
mmetsp:Transcript_4769/g.13709  ORF Transcript_4769/g.13709 Transcript_4769/m.13709 type:complete len:252 (+) Transcript_4769:1330-2085(+)